MTSNLTSRRSFLAASASIAGLSTFGSIQNILAAENETMRFGLVTYLWGQDWDLETLIKNCEAAKIYGVELRTEHAHGVQPEISAEKRKEVKKRFEDSPVINIGPGTNERFDSPNPDELKKFIERTKEWVLLSHDVGGSGVKVKPDSFREGLSREKTIEQIGKSLNVVGKFAADHGQEIRVEVHGTCAELPTIKAIFDYVEEPSVGVCWNSNGEDLKGEGLEYNFNLVKDRFGRTVHVRELNIGDYPYQQLMDLFKSVNYTGWILLEARTKPEDRVKALIEQREFFEKMIA